MKTHVTNCFRVLVLFTLSIVICHVDVMANPCCIIVVPPTPPPAPPQQTNEPSPNFYGNVYATLPVEFALKLRLFNTKLNVEVQAKSFQEGVAAVLAMQGTLGIAPIDILARYKAETHADVEITGVLVNRSYYSILVMMTGLKGFSQLKGQRVGVTGGLDQLFAAEALRASGINPSDVKFVRVPLPQRYSALGKTVDAGAFPLGWEAEKTPKVTKLEFPSSSTMPAWILFASKQTIDKEPDQLSSLRDGLTKAVGTLKSEPTAARPLLSEKYQVKDRESQDRIINNLRIVLASSITPDSRQIENTVKTMRLLNLIKEDVQLIDSSRVKQ